LDNNEISPSIIIDVDENENENEDRTTANRNMRAKRHSIIKHTRNRITKILEDRFCKKLCSSLCGDISTKIKDSNDSAYIKKVEKILFMRSKNNLEVYADERTLDDRLRNIMIALLRRRICQSYKARQISV